MGTSIPAGPRWTDAASPAEWPLWHWAVELLDGRGLVLPQVAMTLGNGGRTREAEADLVLVDTEHGVTEVEGRGRHAVVRLASCRMATT